MAGQSWVTHTGRAKASIVHHLPRPGQPWRALGAAGGDGHLGWHGKGVRWATPLGSLSTRESWAVTALCQVHALI